MRTSLFKGLLLIAGCATLGFVAWKILNQQTVPLGRHEMLLRSEQIAEMPTVGERGLVMLVQRREKDGQGYVILKADDAQNSLLGSRETPLGFLHRDLSSDTDTPLYACLMLRGDKDIPWISKYEDCRPEGRPQSREPVGYVSSKIRTGYRLLFQCTTPEKHTYLSLSSKCDSEKDSPIEVLGALRMRVHPVSEANAGP